MSRHRAERLARIAQSKGIYARAHGSAPSRSGASTPWLYFVMLMVPQQPLPAWCYNTRSFFSTLRYALDYKRAIS
jgi:hypothetical protein